MMSGLQQTLNELGRHLRDPRHTRRPAGLPARPVALYSELLFNNVAEFLDACFPVCRSVLGTTRWQRLQRRFFRDWPSRTPWFREIPREFLAFLVAQGASCRLPAWFGELAHYEWAELAVDVMNCAAPAYRADGDLMHTPVVANPALMNLAYQWPVHRIGADYRPRRPEATHLVLYRDRDEAVRFYRLTPASARLLALLGEGHSTGEAAILRLAKELAHPEPARMLDFGRDEIRNFHDLGLILGVLP